jgi:hypothetical protein
MLAYLRQAASTGERQCLYFTNYARCARSLSAGRGGTGAAGGADAREGLQPTSRESRLGALKSCSSLLTEACQAEPGCMNIHHLTLVTGSPLMPFFARRNSFGHIGATGCVMRDSACGVCLAGSPWLRSTAYSVSFTAQQPERAGAADCLVPAVYPEPPVQALSSLLRRGPGDAQLIGDDREGHGLREVTQDLRF